MARAGDEPTATFNGPQYFPLLKNRFSNNVSAYGVTIGTDSWAMIGP